MHTNKLLNLSPSNLSLHLFLIVIFAFLATGGLLVEMPLIPSIYDKKRVLQLVLIASCCLIILTSYSIRQRIHDILITMPKLLSLSLLTIVALSLISSFQAPEINYALTEVLLFLGLALLSLSVAAVITLNSQLTIAVIIWALLIFAAYYEVIFFTSYIASINIDGRANTYMMFAGFSHMRFLTQYQIWSLPLLCLPLLIQPKQHNISRIAIILVSILWFTILFASTGRGATLSYILAFAASLLFFRSKAVPLFKLNALCSIIGLVLYVLLFLIIPPAINRWDIAHATATKPISLRFTLWLQALEYIKDSPWLGIGPMHYAYYPNTIAAHPHNSTLQLAAEFGLPTTLTLIVLFIWFLYKWVKATPDKETTLTKSEHPSAMTLWVALFFSLLSGLLYSQFSGVIVMPLSQSALAVIIGVMLGMYYLRIDSTKLSRSENKPRFLLVMISAGIILTSLTYLVTPQLTTRVLAPFWAQTLPDSVTGPRFWSLGGIVHHQRTYESLY
jgi:putative inorganic carbon (hco3(-)) transporter